MVSNEEKLLKSRIQFVLKDKKCPIAWIDQNPTMQARLGRQINGEAAVPYTTLRTILFMFPDISADWLIMGEGSMYKAEHSGSSIYTTHYHNEVAPNSYQYGPINMGKDTTQIIKNNEIEKLNQQIMLLQKENEELRRDKEFQRTIIESLTAARK